MTTTWRLPQLQLRQKAIDSLRSFLFDDAESRLIVSRRDEGHRCEMVEQVQCVQEWSVLDELIAEDRR